jgi:hypothetical protein
MSTPWTEGHKRISEILYRCANPSYGHALAAEAAVRSAWAHHAFTAALPAEILDVLTEEDQWIAKLQQRAPRTRTELARFIDTTVLAEAQQPVGRTP